MRGWRYMPFALRQQMIEFIFQPLLVEIQDSDVVWCHNWPYIAEGLQGAIGKRNARLVYHCHNSLRPYAGRRLFERLKPDAVIFNSEAMRQEALSCFPTLQKTETIHNGADESLFHPASPPRLVNDPASLVILYVGRLVPIKGVHVLIEALRILDSRGLRPSCRIIGSHHAGDSGETTKYIRSLHRNAASNVCFEGFLSAKAVAQAYREADILCCPSIWQEPFGLVNIEAMATGIPVVASCVGGIPEVAEFGGILLTKPGSPEDLADALESLLMNSELRQKIGSEGLAVFRSRFTSRSIVKEYQAVIDRISDKRILGVKRALLA